LGNVVNSQTFRGSVVKIPAPRPLELLDNRLWKDRGASLVIYMGMSRSRAAKELVLADPQTILGSSNSVQVPVATKDHALPW
jgi:hypothetical protein